MGLASFNRRRRELAKEKLNKKADINEDKEVKKPTTKSKK